MNVWKCIGRAKACTWGKPHRAKRKQANRAVRAIHKAEINKAK